MGIITIKLEKGDLKVRAIKAPKDQVTTPKETHYFSTKGLSQEGLP